jgi:DNA-binding transcriptional MerR regulator
MTERLLGPREVAHATGVSTDTLRHYERKGLLPGVHRTTAGYRRYSSATVDRVLLIQRALVVGFSLADLGRVLKQRDRGGAPCQSVRDLVGRRLASLERRIEELLSLRDELRELTTDWDTRLKTIPSGQPARLLDTLGGVPTIERARRNRASVTGDRRQERGDEDRDKRQVKDPQDTAMGMRTDSN